MNDHNNDIYNEHQHEKAYIGETFQHAAGYSTGSTSIKVFDYYPWEFRRVYDDELEVKR